MRCSGSGSLRLRDRNRLLTRPSQADTGSGSFAVIWEPDGIVFSSAFPSVVPPDEPAPAEFELPGGPYWLSVGIPSAAGPWVGVPSMSPPGLEESPRPSCSHGVRGLVAVKTGHARCQARMRLIAESNRRRRPPRGLIRLSGRNLAMSAAASLGAAKAKCCRQRKVLRRRPRLGRSIGLVSLKCAGSISSGTARHADRPRRSLDPIRLIITLRARRSRRPGTVQVDNSLVMTDHRPPVIRRSVTSVVISSRPCNGVRPHPS